MFRQIASVAISGFVAASSVVGLAGQAMAQPFNASMVRTLQTENEDFVRAYNAGMANLGYGYLRASDTVVDYARTSCQSLDTGVSIARINSIYMDSLYEQGFTQSQMRPAMAAGSVAIVAAIHTMCPQHRVALERFLNN